MRAFSRHSSYSRAARVGHHPAAHAEAGEAPLAVGQDGADGDAERGGPVGTRPAHRSRVDAAGSGLGRGHDLHRALLRRAGDRRAGEERRQDRREGGTAARGHGRGHLQEGRVALDLEERGHLHAPDLGHLPEVVPQHVHDHEVLGPLLLRLAQVGRLGLVLLRRGPARGRPLHRPRGEPPPSRRKKSSGEAHTTAKRPRSTSAAWRGRCVASSRAKSASGSSASGARSGKVKLTW